MKDPKAVTTLSDDALQKRIARLVGDVKVAKAINGDSNVCLGTSLGSVRKNNQDRALVVWADYSESPHRNFTLAVLSDGMGGLANGEEAATIALSVFVARVLRTPRVALPERLMNAAILSNNAVYGRFGGRGGATLSAAFISNSGDKVGVNVGDSRIYAITTARELIQLSRDDTLAGVLGEEHRSNENHNRLVQFMGMGEGIEPNIVNLDRNGIETILLTSDGVHGAPMAALSQIVRRARSEADITRKVLSLSELLGGQDNGTAITLGMETKRIPFDAEQGLNLTFLSVNERLEIWIPVLGDDARLDRPRAPIKNLSEPTAHPRASAPPQSELPRTTATAEEAKRKRKSRVRAKQSSKKTEPEEASLPLDDDNAAPVLDVKFPPSE